jgi:hypothetical protein
MSCVRPGGKEVSMSVHKVLILGVIGHATDYANV